MARGAVDDWLAGAVRTMLRRIGQLESDAKLLKTSVEVSSCMPSWKDQFLKEMQKGVQSAVKMKEAEDREFLLKEISKGVQSAMKEAEECKGKVLPVEVKNVQSQLLRVESTVRDNTVDFPHDLPVVGAAQCDEQPAHDQLANHSRVAHCAERVEDAQPASHSKVADCDGHSDAQPANHPKGADRDEQSEDAQLAHHSKVPCCDAHSEDAQLANHGHSKFYDCTEHWHEFDEVDHFAARDEDAQPANHSKVADCAERVQDAQPANHSKVADRDEQFEDVQIFRWGYLVLRASHAKVDHCAEHSVKAQPTNHSNVASCDEHSEDAQFADHSKVAHCAEHPEDDQLASHPKVAQCAAHSVEAKPANHSKVACSAGHSEDAQLAAEFVPRMPAKVSKFYQLAEKAKKTAEKYKKFNELNGGDDSQNPFNIIPAKAPSIFDAKNWCDNELEKTDTSIDDKTDKAEVVVNLNSYFYQLEDLCNELLPILEQEKMKKCDVDEEAAVDMTAFLEEITRNKVVKKVQFSHEDSVKARYDEAKQKRR